MSTRAAAILFALCVAAGTVSPEGFKNPPDGAAALGQAGAFVAQADDPSAVTANPAGLVQMRGQQLLLSLTTVFPSTRYETPGYAAERKTTPSFLPSLFYCTELSTERLRFGIGITPSFGQTTSWPAETVRFWNDTAPVSAGMRTIGVTPVVAYAVSDSLSLGAGLTVYSSELSVDQLLLLPGPVELPVALRADGVGCAPSFGLLYRADRWQAGLAYHAAFSVDYGGKMVVPGLLRLPARSSIDFPHVVDAGVAFFPKRNWKVEADVEWLGWSCLEAIPVWVYGIPLPQPARNWDNSLTIEAGTEITIRERVKIRAGAAFIQSPVPAETWEPGFPDADRVCVSLGIGVPAGRGTVDIAVVGSFFDTRAIHQGAPYDGTFASTAYFTAGSLRLPF